MTKTRRCCFVLVNHSLGSPSHALPLLPKHETEYKGRAGRTVGRGIWTSPRGLRAAATPRPCSGSPGCDSKQRAWPFVEPPLRVDADRKQVDGWVTGQRHACGCRGWGNETQSGPGPLRWGGRQTALPGSDRGLEGAGQPQLSPRGERVQLGVISGWQCVLLRVPKPPNVFSDPQCPRKAGHEVWVPGSCQCPGGPVLGIKHVARVAW